LVHISCSKHGVCEVVFAKNALCLFSAVLFWSDRLFARKTSDFSETTGACALLMLRCVCLGNCGRLHQPNSSKAINRNPCLECFSFIPIVKPTTGSNVSNLFYFGMTLYMFRTVFPSIIRSSRLYIQQQAFVEQILLSAC